MIPVLAYGDHDTEALRAHASAFAEPGVHALCRWDELADKRLPERFEAGRRLGFTVRVREDYDERTVLAVMMLEVTGKSTTQVIRELRGFPEIYSLHTTNGNWDLVADIRASSLSDFDRVLREIRLIDGIANSETSLLLSSV